jgi:hypothetical protein
VTQHNNESEHIYYSTIKFNSTQPGFSSCVGTNELGQSYSKADFQIWDISEPIEILRSNENITEVGDSITLECRALIYNYTDKIYWTRNGSQMMNRNDIEINENHTKFSYGKSLTFKKIRFEDSGEYRCEIHDKEGNKHHVTTYIDIQPPYNILDEGETSNCSIIGISVAEVIW